MMAADVCLIARGQCVTLSLDTDPATEFPGTYRGTDQYRPLERQLSPRASTGCQVYLSVRDGCMGRFFALALALGLGINLLAQQAEKADFVLNVPPPTNV